MSSRCNLREFPAGAMLVSSPKGAGDSMKYYGKFDLVRELEKIALGRKSKVPVSVLAALAAESLKQR